MRFGTDLYRNMYLRVKAGQCLQSKKEGEIIGLFEKRQKKDMSLILTFPDIRKKMFKQN